MPTSERWTLNDVIYRYWGNSRVMDYEGYTFVFFLSNYKQEFPLKCYMYYDYTFQP